MSLTLEDFLNAEFFCELIKKRLDGEDFNLISHNVTNITGKGEGYMGTIFKGLTKISRKNCGASEEVDFIIKVGGEDGFVSTVSGPFKPYEKEIEMYNSILPAFEKFYSGYKLAPICYKAMMEPFQIIVMENLKTHGFQLGPRSGFDLNHSLLVVKQMARYHAASVKYIEKIGPYSEFLRTTGMYSKFIETNDWGKFVNNLFSTFRRLSKSIPDFEKESAKLDELGENFLGHVTAATDHNSKDFCVLNHGDLWNFNILFKYENEQPKAVIFIDYQLCCYGTFAHDFLFFLTTSVKGADREVAYDILTSAYYEELQAALSEIEYSIKIPTLEELQLELQRKSVLAVAAFVESYAISEITEGDAVKFDMVLREDEEGEAYRRLLLSNPKVIETAKVYFPFLRKKGMMDVK